jgi:hypothetical protein
MIVSAQNFGLIKANFGRFFLGQNFSQIIGRFSLEKNSPNATIFFPNGEISPNLVTLMVLSSLIDVVFDLK